MKELVIEATLDRLDEVLAFVGEELENGGCDVKTQTQIGIAVEEIFVNIAHYAYNPDVGGAVIRISAGDEVTIVFEDKGTPYNPLEKRDPDITKPAEEREIGGLGIFMVKKIMDNVTYRNEDGKNILSISKQLTEKAHDCTTISADCGTKQG